MYHSKYTKTQIEFIKISYHSLQWLMKAMKNQLMSSNQLITLKLDNEKIKKN